MNNSLRITFYVSRRLEQPLVVAIQPRCFLHHSPFTIRHSPFAIHHSLFAIHHSPFTIRFIRHSPQACYTCRKLTL